MVSKVKKNPVPNTTEPRSHFRQISVIPAKNRVVQHTECAPATVIDGIKEDTEYPHFEVVLFEGSEYLLLNVEGYLAVMGLEVIAPSAVKATIWVERIDQNTTRLNGVFFSAKGEMLRVFNMEIPSN